MEQSVDLKPNTIDFLSHGEEMLSIGPTGFWVRGKKLKQDDKEAQEVYNAFTAWLAWAQLNNRVIR
jgi:hypothetical protein